MVRIDTLVNISVEAIRKKDEDAAAQGTALSDTRESSDNNADRPAQLERSDGYAYMKP